MGEPPKFSENAEPSQASSSEKRKCVVHQHLHPTASSLPSCVSMKSTKSMGEPPKFSENGEHSQASERKKPMGQDQSRSLAEGFKRYLDVKPSTPAEEQIKVNQRIDDVMRIKEHHKANMKKKYDCLFEAINKQENKTLLSKIYTALYIIEGEREGVNQEHEVVQIEKAKTERLQGTPIDCNDIFQPKTDQRFGRIEDENIRIVLTKGIAGIGKTVSVQKFILDWAEGKANQDVDFVFVLPFRELNLVKDETYNLHRLLLDFHPGLTELDTRMFDLCKVLFVFDGLDESRISLAFSQCECISGVSTTSSVSVLISNLITGDLLPTALIWITSRPIAASQIPSHFVSRVTEVQGFNDPQKEEYFSKKISSPAHLRRIISHIKKARSLYIMCHIPVFCWITATVLQSILEQNESAEIPQTLTEMYIHYLIIQLDVKREKFEDGSIREPQSLLKANRCLILKLAGLAFKGLMNGDILFYDEDLKACGIDGDEANVRSGFCTELFKEESVISSRKVYCFIHLSFQEFFAAVFVFASYLDKNADVLKLFQKKTRRKKIHQSGDDVLLDVFLNGVIDEALKSTNGHLDLFLRFLHGICLESNQEILQGLFTRVEIHPECMKNMMKNLRQGQQKNVRPERWINLSQCLMEMKDTSVFEDIQAYLNKTGKNKKYLSSSHCSALANMLLMEEEVVEELDLKKYDTTSMQAAKRLIPAVRNCRRAKLAGFNLTEESCETVASALHQENSPLREVDMNNNELFDSGVKFISLGLKSPHCKLEILRLKGCKLTMESCETIASALLSPNSCLRALDLSYNDLQDSGVEKLVPGLKSPYCKLEMLSLAGSKLTEQSCEILASIMHYLEHLRDLDLNNNALQDSGLLQLAAGLKTCQLEKLRLVRCSLTVESCKVLALILQSANCVLKELDLSDNELQDTGVEILTTGMKSPDCKLEILRLSVCNLTERSCAAVASVFQRENTLRELNLSKNDLRDSGVRMLSDGLNNSNCRLETLRLSGCFITDEGYSALASALASNPLHLKELDLSCNHPGGSGAQLLTARLHDEACKLEKLNLEHEGKFRIAAGLRRYAWELTLDPNTAHKHLYLSDGNRTVMHVEDEQSYPDRSERFECVPQVLCRQKLSGRCSWEIEWSGKSGVYVSVSYEGIERKGKGDDCKFGCNDKSWRLDCLEKSYTSWHSNKSIKIRPPSTSNRSKRLGVYLDCPGGTLSFYHISDKNNLTHLHTFRSGISEPLYAGFGLHSGSAVSLGSLSLAV